MSKISRPLIIAGISLSFFSALALLVNVSGIPVIDEYVMSVFPRLNRPQFHQIAVFASKLGTFKTILILSLPLVVWLAVKQPRNAQSFLLSFAISPLSAVLKRIFLRERPEELLVGFKTVVSNSASFPSGHTLISVSVYGFMIILLWRSKLHKAIRIIGTTVLGLIIFSVAVSRVYLGVHYPTDVIGSFLFGIGWLAIICGLEQHVNTKTSPSVLDIIDSQTT